MTGESEISANAILEYFQPLQDFLKIENSVRMEREIQVKLNNYNLVATQQMNKLQLAEWNYITDINNQSKIEAKKRATNENAKFVKQQYNKHFKGLKPEDFTNESIQRQILYLSKLGVNILNESRLNELSNAKSSMQKIYNNAVFCDYFNQNCRPNEMLTLDPGELFLNYTNLFNVFIFLIIFFCRNCGHNDQFY